MLAMIESSTKDDVITFAFLSTSITELLVAETGGRLVAIIMQERRDEEALIGELRRRFPTSELRHAPAALKASIRAIADFVEHPHTDLKLPLDIRGTAFQRKVWEHILTVPFGTTTTFADVATAVGSPRAVRAVGSACTRNPLEFAIPCHRVLRSDGRFSGGSAWGDRRQATLVHREAAAEILNS
jgi:AraC family transcriptional regulator of adaptative response/methylated-DNA-[protein]-cysteine methyltransferase